MHYTIRYRTRDLRGRPALIVEDSDGGACLVSGGQLQACLAARGEEDPCARLVALLGSRAHWTRVIDSLTGAFQPFHRCDSASPEAEA